MQTTYPPSTSLNGAIYLVLLLLIIVAMRWEAVAAVGIGVLVVLWVVERLFVSEEGALGWVVSSVNPMILAFLGLCALQLVPLPAALLAKLSPAAFADKTEAAAILSGGEGLVRAAAAYAPDKAFVKLAALAAAAGAFFLALNTLASRARITGALGALVGLGVIEALLAVGRLFSGAADPAADFAAAGILAGALPATLGLYLSIEKRTERLESGLDGGRAALQRMVGQVAPESVRPAGVTLFLSALGIAGGLFLCAPPVVRFVAAFSLGAAAVLFFAGKRNKKGGLVFLVFALFFLFTVGAGPADAPVSTATARSVSAAAKDYPLLGLGLGSFTDLAPRYVDPADSKQALSPPNPPPATRHLPAADFDSGLTTDHPPPTTHPVPRLLFGAELSAETGVLAFAVLLFAGGYMVFRIGRIRYLRRDQHASAVGAGAGAGFLALLLLALAGPHTLSYAHLLCGALLAAAGKAAVFRRGRGFNETFFYQSRRITLPLPARFAALAAVTAVLAALAVSASQNFEMWPTPTTHNPQPTGLIEAALLKNPAQPQHWLAIGRLYNARRDDPFAYIETWLPRADVSFEQAVSYAPFDSKILLAAANHFVERAAMLPAQNSGRAEAVERFQEYYRRALAQAPSLWAEAADRVWTFFPEERVVLGIVPEGMEEMRDRVLRYIVGKGPG